MKIDPSYYQPTEVDLLIGDAAKAKRMLGWEPKVSFEELVIMVVDADVRAERQTLEGTRVFRARGMMEAGGKCFAQ